MRKVINMFGVQNKVGAGESKNKNGQTEFRFAHFSEPDWIRTNDPQLRRLMLYPAELPVQSSFVFDGCKCNF